MRYVFDTMIIIYTVVQLFGITVQILVQIILLCLTLLKCTVSKLISGYTVMKLDQQRSKMIHL